MRVPSLASLVLRPFLSMAGKSPEISLWKLLKRSSTRSLQGQNDLEVKDEIGLTVICTDPRSPLSSDFFRPQPSCSLWIESCAMISYASVEKNSCVSGYE